MTGGLVRAADLRVWSLVCSISTIRNLRCEFSGPTPGLWLTKVGAHHCDLLGVLTLVLGGCWEPLSWVCLRSGLEAVLAQDWQTWTFRILPLAVSLTPWTWLLPNFPANNFWTKPRPHPSPGIDSNSWGSRLKPLRGKKLSPTASYALGALPSGNCTSSGYKALLCRSYFPTAAFRVQQGQCEGVVRPHAWSSGADFEAVVLS